MTPLTQLLSATPGRGRIDKHEVIRCLDVPDLVKEWMGERVIRQTDRQIQARCPWHDDARASMSINAETGSWMCHAGCGKGSIFDLESRLHGGDWIDSLHRLAQRAGVISAPPSRVVNTYDYVDENGTVLYQTCRMDPKDFRQRQPAADGGWIWSLEGVRRVLYRLPEVLAAETVYVVEGEKDADAVAQIGLCATTSPLGAGKWQAEYADVLAGKRVVVLPDNDEPGRKHAADIARSLQGKAESVKIVDLPGLPEKGDISDWLSKGGTKEFLLALVESVPECCVPAASDPRTPRSRVAAPTVPPKPTLAPEAYHGLPGEIVRAVEPFTEADPAAILVNVLVRFGVAVGSGPGFYVGDTRHAANEFALIVGQTAQSRKGTSESTPRRLFDEADSDFGKRVFSGLSSGEGVIHAVRDERREQEPIKEKGHVVGYQEVVVDHGVEDKRLLVVESEFAQTLAVLTREGNTLGPVLRNAWDGARLSTLTKNNSETATDAHIGIIGHITKDELLRKLAEGDAFNGFLNRFLLIEVSRSKLLPEGARLPESVAADLARRLTIALDKARRVGTMRRDDEARELWAMAYTELEKPQPGLYGALRARGSAHVLRLSMIYALADGEGTIRVPHIEAALAVWDYAEASIRRIFGDRTGDSVADRILETLQAGPMSETQLRDEFSRNLKSARLSQAFYLLRDAGRIEAVRVETGGRPRTEWSLCR